MKTGHYVEGLSNTARLYATVRQAEERGAPEACWVLAEGKPGFGKSRDILKLAFHKSAAIVRAKAGWTPRWMLTDLADALGVARAHRAQDLFNAVLAELMQRPRMLVIDEIDHAARNLFALETLRDLTDASECVLLAAGMEGARGMMKRYPQIYSRIAAIVTYGPATADDVQTMCAQLTDVQIGDDLAAKIQARTNGRLRDVMNAIARVEAFGRKQRGIITSEMYGERPLLNDDRAPKLAVVG